MSPDARSRHNNSSDGCQSPASVVPQGLSNRPYTGSDQPKLNGGTLGVAVNKKVDCRKGGPQWYARISLASQHSDRSCLKTSNGNRSRRFRRRHVSPSWSAIQPNRLLTSSG